MEPLHRWKGVPTTARSESVAGYEPAPPWAAIAVLPVVMLAGHTCFATTTSPMAEPVATEPEERHPGSVLHSARTGGME